MAKSKIKVANAQTADPHQTPVCAEFHRTIELIGKRWTGSVLAVLMAGPRRFNEILNAVPGLSDRLLTERLRELENNGIAERRIFAERPVRILVAREASREPRAQIGLGNPKVLLAKFAVQRNVRS